MHNKQNKVIILFFLMFEEMKTQVDFNKMCRLCTKSSVSLYSLYEDHNDGISALEKLQVICGIQVLDDDGYPKYICKSCRKKLKVCYDFKIMCLSSHEILSNYSSTNQNKNDSDTETRYFIELEDDLTVDNYEELQLSDIEPYLNSTENKQTDEIIKNNTKKSIAKIKSNNLNKNPHCKVCKKRFNSKLRVKLHMQRLHKQIYLAECKVVCPKCDMRFEHVKNLRRHLVYHNKDSYFGCPFCDVKLLSKMSWRKHIKVHDEKINTLCIVCNKMISSKVSLVYHMEYHKTRTILMHKTFYSCYTCKIDFEDFSELEKHCLDNHCLETPDEHDYLKNESKVLNLNASVTLRCNICSRFYKNLNDLNSHVIECCRKINRPKSFMCDVCGKCFKSSCTLVTHAAGHSSVRTYICDICGQRFKWHNDLTNHKSRIHEHFRPYVCRVCGKKCNTSATLKSHMRLHTGERPYVCKECGARFAQNSSLKEHAFKHTGGQQGTCPICAKVFQTQLRLRIHLKRHNTQRKLFPCDLCNRMFTEKSSVRKHKLKIHTSPNFS